MSLPCENGCGRDAVPHHSMGRPDLCAGCEEAAKHRHETTIAGAVGLPPLPGDLGMNHYQKASEERLGSFGHDLAGFSLLEWAGAAAGEVGEVANVCKKLRRQELKVGGRWAERDPDKATLLKALAGEIGDSLAYLSLLASAAGLSLAECAAEKFDFASEYQGWPGERLMEKLAVEPPLAPEAKEEAEVVA